VESRLNFTSAFRRDTFISFHTGWFGLAHNWTEKKRKENKSYIWRSVPKSSSVPMQHKDDP
jgi:hypothetical protein